MAKILYTQEVLYATLFVTVALSQERLLLFGHMIAFMRASG